MHGLCEDNMLGVRKVFSDREGKAMWSCPEKVSVAICRAIGKGMPPHCPLGFAYVQLWLLLTKPRLVLVEVLLP